MEEVIGSNPIFSTPNKDATSDEWFLFLAARKRKAPVFPRNTGALRLPSCTTLLRNHFGIGHDVVQFVDIIGV